MVKVSKTKKSKKKVTRPKKSTKKTTKKVAKKTPKKVSKTTKKKVSKKAVKKKVVKKPAKKKISKKVVKKVVKSPKKAAATKPKKVKKIKSPFKKKDLDFFKNKLLLIQAKITGDVTQLEKNALMNTRDASGDLSGCGLHMADAATDFWDQELNLGLASTEQNLLNRIEDALKRIAEGTYGVSVQSGKPISKRRLNAVPYAELTIEEQEEEEKNQRKGF